MKHQVSADQINFYQANGYIVIEDFLICGRTGTLEKSGYYCR